jgi:hypothetical protein
MLWPHSQKARVLVVLVLVGVLLLLVWIFVHRRSSSRHNAKQQQQQQQQKANKGSRQGGSVSSSYTLPNVRTLSVLKDTPLEHKYATVFLQEFRYRAGVDAAHAGMIAFSPPQSWEDAEAQNFVSTSPWESIHTVLYNWKHLNAIRANAAPSAQQKSIWTCAVLQHYFYPSQLFGPFQDQILGRPLSSWASSIRRDSGSGAVTATLHDAYVSTYQNHASSSPQAYSTLVNTFAAATGQSSYSNDRRATLRELDTIVHDLAPLWEAQHNGRPRQTWTQAERDDHDQRKRQCQVLMGIPFAHKYAYPETAPVMTPLRCWMYLACILEAMFRHPTFHLPHDVDTTIDHLYTMLRALFDHPKMTVRHKRSAITTYGAPLDWHRAEWTRVLKQPQGEKQEQETVGVGEHNLDDTTSDDDDDVLIPVPYDTHKGTLKTPCVISGLYGPLGAIYHQWNRDRVNGLPPPTQLDGNIDELHNNIPLQCGHFMSTRPELLGQKGES